MQFRKATAELRAIWVLGNEYLTEPRPGRRSRPIGRGRGHAIRIGVNLIRLFAMLSAPIIPFALKRDGAVRCTSTPRTLHWPKGLIADEIAVLAARPAFDTPPVLFAKIAPEQITAWETRFGGMLSERNTRRSRAHVAGHNPSTPIASRRLALSPQASGTLGRGSALPLAWWTRASAVCALACARLTHWQA